MSRTPRSPGNLTASAHTAPAAAKHDLAEVAVDADLSACAANQLATQAQAGNAAAFAELFCRFHPRLIRFLEKRLASRCDAEDVSQEALAKAWQALASYNPKYQFATWLYTIAVRVAADHLRRRSRGMALADSRSSDSWAAPQPEPLHLVEQAEDADNIWAVARQVLNRDQFSILWLRYGEELTVKEVAKILNKTAVGVRVALHRSRTALQPHLLDYTASGQPTDSGRTIEDHCT